MASYSVDISPDRVIAKLRERISQLEFEAVVLSCAVDASQAALAEEQAREKESGEEPERIPRKGKRVS